MKISTMSNLNLESPSVDWNTLKLCALGDLRVDKSLVFKTEPFSFIQ